MFSASLLCNPKDDEELREWQRGWDDADRMARLERPGELHSPNRSKLHDNNPESDDSRRRNQQIL